MFSFHWAETIKTIKYYEFSVKDPRNLFIGGPMATLMADEIQKETGFIPVKGLLNVKGKLQLSGDHEMDDMIPDYSILDTIKYKYNVLASSKFDYIIDEIQEACFHKGTKFNNSLRHVDFNQGIDLRLLTKRRPL